MKCFARYTSSCVSGKPSGWQAEWLAQVREQPGSFADLETHIHQTFQQMADQVVAGVLAQVAASNDFTKDAKKK